MLTKQDMFAALKHHPKAAEAIFWWCCAWHSGVDSDLYKIMCDDSLGYVPTPTRKWADDPEILAMFDRLGEVFGEPEQMPYELVKLADVKEGQMLVAGSSFACLLNRWPCRVYRHHGALGVACSGAVHGVKLLPGSETTFHPLTEDEHGFVVGFRR